MGCTRTSRTDCLESRLLDETKGVTQLIAAAATALFFLTIGYGGFPGLDDTPGLPLFVMPFVVYAAIEMLFERLHVDEQRQAAIGRVTAWLAAVVCVGFVLASLASPTHRECVEYESDGCVQYELGAGPDMQGAGLWGLGVWIAASLALHKPKPKPSPPVVPRALEKNQWRGS